MSAGVVGRHRTGLLVALGVLAVLVVIAVLGRDSSPYDGALDPRNPSPDGGQALARVLDQQGVDVEVARDQAAFLDERVDATTTVVVTGPDQLAPSTLDRLHEHARGAGAVVYVGDPVVLAAQLDTDVARVPAGEREAGCQDDLVDGLTVRLDGGGLRGEGCFGADGGVALLRDGSTWALASPGSLSNDRILDADDAALGLRLLGQGERVVWYVPDLADASATEGFSLTSLLPRWLFPALGLLAAVLLSVVLWRGRRLGPLVTEPLPVVVRAAESTHSRGRIYRRTKDRAHATHILAAATRHRLERALSLPPRVDPQVLAGEVATRTGRDPTAVLALIHPTTAPHDAALVTLGRRLSELEDEVSPR